MKLIVSCIVVALSAVGCATVQNETLPKFGEGLNKIHEGWDIASKAESAICADQEQAPVLVQWCPDITTGREVMKTGLNSLKGVYDQLNSEAE